MRQACRSPAPAPMDDQFMGIVVGVNETLPGSFQVCAAEACPAAGVGECTRVRSQGAGLASVFALRDAFPAMLSRARTFWEDPPGRSHPLLEKTMANVLSQVKSRFTSRALQALVPSGFYFRQEGYCPCCRNQTFFLSLESWLRDHFK